MNPFDYQNPAEDDTFSGRTKEVDWIKESYEKTFYGQPSHIFLYGEERMGKTSLLRHIKRHPPTDRRVLFLYVRLGNCESMTDVSKKIVDTLYQELRGEEALFHRFVSFLTTNVKGIKVGPLGITWNPREKSFEQLHFINMLVELWGTVSDAYDCLTILIDETEAIASSEQFTKAFAISMKTFLEELSEKGPNQVKFIISAVLDLYKNIPSQHSSFLKICEVKSIKRFDEHAAKELLQRGLKAVAKRRLGIFTDEKAFSDDFLASAFRCSDGIPHHLQLIYNRAFQFDDDRNLTQEDFGRGIFGYNKEEGAIDILEQVAFGPFHQTAKSACGRVDELLAFLSDSPNQAVTLDALADNFKDVERSTLISNMSTLKANHFLAPDQPKGTYKLSSNLCRIWVDKLIKGLSDQSIKLIT